MCRSRNKIFFARLLLTGSCRRDNYTTCHIVLNIFDMNTNEWLEHSCLGVFPEFKCSYEVTNYKTMHSFIIIIVYFFVLHDKMNGRLIDSSH